MLPKAKNLLACTHLQHKIKKMPKKSISDDEEQEWPIVTNYFRKHPRAFYAGKKTEGLALNHSYFCVEGNIYRRNHELGKGTFGRARSASTQNGQTIVIKGQKKANSSAEMRLFYNEAAINHELGIALSEIIERDHKVYLLMPYLGTPINQAIHEFTNSELLLKISLNFLLQIYTLHKRFYVHQNIKPDNVLFHHDKIFLIDWAFGVRTNLNRPHQPLCGTAKYMPILNNGLIPTVPDYYFQDEIGAYRTLYHPAFEDGIFTKVTFVNTLPTWLRERLNTSDLDACLRNREKYRLSFILSLFIFYVQYRREPSENEFSILFQDDQFQEAFIHHYQVNLNTRVYFSRISSPTKVDKEKLHRYPDSGLLQFILCGKLTFQDLRYAQIDQEMYVYLVCHYYQFSKQDLLNEALYEQYPTMLQDPNIVYAIFLLKRAPFKLYAMGLFPLMLEGHVSEQDVELDLDTSWGEKLAGLKLRTSILSTSTKKTLGTQEEKSEKEHRIFNQLKAFKLAFIKCQCSGFAPVLVGNLQQEFNLLWETVALRRNKLTRSFPVFFSHPTFLPKTALDLIDFLLQDEQKTLRVLLKLPDEKEKMISRLTKPHHEAQVNSPQ